MTVKARITCENNPPRRLLILLLPLSTHAFNCRRTQLRTEEGEGLVSRLRIIRAVRRFPEAEEFEDDEIEFLPISRQKMAFVIHVIRFLCFCFLVVDVSSCSGKQYTDP